MFAREPLLIPGYGWIAAVPAWRASAEERAGALTRFELASLLAEVRRSGDRRRLLAVYRAATGLDPWAAGELREQALVAAIDAAVAKGQLLLLRTDMTGRSAGEGPTRDTAEDRLIDGVMQGRATLPFEGRQYRFTPAGRWTPRDGGRDYVALRAPAARELLARMEASLARTPADHAGWRAVARALTDPQSGAGILVLRYAPPVAGPSPKPDLPVVTPSQLAPKVAQQDWIELQLEWDDGSPFDGDFLLTLPGNRTTKGPPDDGGIVRVDGLDPGQCKLTFPAVFPDMDA